MSRLPKTSSHGFSFVRDSPIEECLLAVTTAFAIHTAVLALASSHRVLLFIPSQTEKSYQKQAGVQVGCVLALNASIRRNDSSIHSCISCFRHHEYITTDASAQLITTFVRSLLPF